MGCQLLNVLLAADPRPLPALINRCCTAAAGLQKTRCLCSASALEALAAWLDQEGGQTLDFTLGAYAIITQACHGVVPASACS